MGRSTVHYADGETNNILKRLHNKLRPAGTPVERVEYIIELLLLRIFEAKLKQDEMFAPLRKLFKGENYRLLFSHLLSLTGDQVLSELNKNLFPFYATILTKAREVISGNMPTKMQDQLVLMEEVFANSNFTNNVKGGVIAEVIGLVNEIDEKWILKSDLLGDAIESALSETGGTKDLGLYRTPEHIRKMMVAMVDPDFSDTIFDPACGTAGFLFDTYEYVIEKAKKTRAIPPEHIANQFYRTGLSGVEYQGRIRKMAAVNMYIRGLNPHNIAQGDSLKMYDPSSDAASKSIVIANPPFGAERDQPAYPNVWEEYAKESETTILFVKLMFDLLKANGRCAVVASEGFLTWGQGSACALRKLLLQEANLKAIISLPQGVFVSKGGQGAKTSILYFEKGQLTDFVWYYKIENDGFSMGTNRKPIEGSQIPELLELFKEIKAGKKPNDTKYSFCVPREWVETLDPRIAERIKAEVKEWLTIKNKAKRVKLVAGLDEKLATKKINKEIRDEKLWQFDNVVETQIENIIAKAIEKAHSYHFNLQNYRSNLSAEQIKEWRELFKGIEPLNSSPVERRYQELRKSDANKALRIIASFDPQNALHADIVREYVSKLEKKDEKLKKLEEILKKGFRYPIVSLKELIVVNGERIKPADYPEQSFTVLGVSNQTGVFVNEVLQGVDIKQAYFKVHKNQFCYNPYRINVGSIGLREFDIENQIISGAYNVFGCKEAELNPKYFEALFNTKQFLDYVNEKATGGVRMDFKIEYMQEWMIPLPPLEIQKQIAAELNGYQKIIDGARQIAANYRPTIKIDPSWETGDLSEIANLIQRGKAPIYGNSEIQVIKSGQARGYFEFDFSERYYVTSDFSLDHRKLQRGDLLINSTGVGTAGRITYFDLDGNFLVDGHVTIVRLDSKQANSMYILFALDSVYGFKGLEKIATGSGGQIELSLTAIKGLRIPLPPLAIQEQVVAQIGDELKLVDANKKLIEIFEQKIKSKIAEVWGES